jgi:hypothetical protein
MVLKGKGSRQKTRGASDPPGPQAQWRETYCSVFLVAKVVYKQVIQFEADDG